MQVRTELICGKRRVIITREASGVDKGKEAVIRVMGPGWKFEDSKKKVET